MAASDDLQALENISNEVDNSQVKILTSSHCMKAQAFLLQKLRKQAERQQEICKFIASSNLKLETEIKFGEQELKSLNIATETIKLGNIELSKEYLLSKERKAEIVERTNTGKKKYDNLWVTSKKRYESIPIIQKLNDVKNKNQTIQANINVFITESKHLVNEVKIKKNALHAADRTRIIELSEFIVRERPKMLIKINDNSVKIKDVINEVEMLQKQGNKSNCDVLYDQPLPIEKQEIETNKDSTFEDNWSNLSKNIEKDTLMLPKLYLQNNDLDILSIKLDQINKVDLQNTMSMKRAASSMALGLEENPNKTLKIEERDNKYISSYFDISLENAGNGDKKLYNNNYSERKLIHILEDVQLDKDEAYKIIKNLEVTQFQATEFITSKNIHKGEKMSNKQDELNSTISVVKNTSPETEEIHEIKLSKSREENVVDPPTQFLDISQTSQEKKTVSFNIPIEVEMTTLLDENMTKSEEIEVQEKMLNNSTTSQESFTAIKDRILRNRNLDLSPQFVYTKSTLVHKQHKEGDKVTSKFFENENSGSQCNNTNENDYNSNIKQDKILKTEEESNLNVKETCTIEENEVVASSPKAEIKNMEVPIAGFIFNHGPHGITDTLNLSISTTGFEDSEDYPHCIDSSVLLSPKADIPGTVQTFQSSDVLSQEVPNFLAGFRKTGLSFFGGTTSTDTKPDSAAQSQSGGFHFAFGNEEKKGRGGFFSMFH